MQLGFIRNGKINQIKEIPVTLDGLCTPPPPPPPPQVPTATTLWDTFILAFFLGQHFTCLHCTNDKWDKGIIEDHPKVFAWMPLQ